MKKLMLSICALLLLVGCTSEKTFKPKETDIINSRVDGVKNYDRFLTFNENVEKGEKDKIRIVHYTLEGDPILSTLIFSGKTITYTYDATEDEYGAGEMLTTKCKSIESKRDVEKTRFVLTECKGDNMGEEILVIES